MAVTAGASHILTGPFFPCACDGCQGDCTCAAHATERLSSRIQTARTRLVGFGCEAARVSHISLFDFSSASLCKYKTRDYSITSYGFMSWSTLEVLRTLSRLGCEIEPATLVEMQSRQPQDQGATCLGASLGRRRYCLHPRCNAYFVHDPNPISHLAISAPASRQLRRASPMPRARRLLIRSRGVSRSTLTTWQARQAWPAASQTSDS